MVKEFLTLSTRSVRKLMEIKKVILDEPKRINMDSWIDSGSYLAAKHRPPCNTTACIAGHAVLLDKTTRKQLIAKNILHILRKKQTKHGVVDVMQVDTFKMTFNYESEGARILGLTSRQAKNLFYLANWPVYLQDAYSERTPVKSAKATADLLDLFIKTNGSYILPEKKQRRKVTA